MAITPPTTEPKSLRVGDTLAWRREDLSDYPASVWTLTYYFRNAANKFSIAATADADLFAVAVNKTTSAGYVAGWYDWLAVVTDGTERYEVDSGRTQLLQNLALDALFDARSFARQMLEAIEAAILGKATTSQLDLVQASLADRSMQYDTAALIKLRTQFKYEVKREDMAREGLGNHRIVVRM